MPPKIRRLFLLPDAAAEMAAIYEPLYSKIAQQLQLLRRFPKLGRAMAPPLEGWRLPVVDLFFVVYREVLRGIEVSQIRHTKRSPLEEL